MSCMLLAALWLVARMIAPAAAMPDPADAIAQAALQTLCHGGADPAPADAPAHVDCLLCPACCLAGQAVLPAPGGPAPRPPSLTLIGHAATLPPATGPPSRPRGTAPPTGPPHLSA